MRVGGEVRVTGWGWRSWFGSEVVRGDTGLMQATVDSPVCVVPSGYLMPPFASPAQSRRYALHAVLAAILLALALPACSNSASTTPKPITPVGVFGGPGLNPGQFAKPRAIDADATTLWVVDRSARIQRLDPETGECIHWFATPESELGKPVGITVAPAPDGSGAPALYVPDTHYNRMMVYLIPALPAKEADGRWPRPVDLRLEPVLVVGSYGEKPGEMIYPTDVAVLTGADGKTVERIYVAEFGGNDRVQAFDRTGKLLFGFGKMGEGADPGALEFNRPQSIAITGRAGDAIDSRQLVIVDSINHRVGIFTLDGVVVRWLGKPGRGMTAGQVDVATGKSAEAELQHPRGLQLEAGGTAILVEFGNNRVQRIDLTTGASLGCWGTPGRGVGQLSEPWSLVSFGAKTFVVDASNHRLVVMQTPR